MEKARPFVSVIIPVHNGERFLGEALESIRRQQYAPVETIVVDDGSTDGSAKVAAGHPGVVVLTKPHSGISDTLNHAIRASHGELLAFLDADDRWLPGKLDAQVRALEEDPLLDMVFVHCRQFTRQSIDGRDQEITVQIQSGVAKSGMLVRRGSFLEVGYFNIDRGFLDFIEWYDRARHAGLSELVLERVLFERRIHDRNVGLIDTDRQRRAALNTLRLAVKRKRQSH